jgi:hypothetical protein
LESIVKEFIALVLISFVMAVPVAHYYLHRWLSTYNYHTGINSIVFIYDAGGVLVITLVTVSFHSIKAAIANPVKNPPIRMSFGFYLRTMNFTQLNPFMQMMTPLPRPLSAGTWFFPYAY